MHRIAKFEKISLAQFRKDFGDGAEAAYEKVTLPVRATAGSAGYDFFAPVPLTIKPGESLTIPTGVRVRIDEGWVLQIYPRSSLGFKFKIALDNTVGIIDSDYYGARNEGHIIIKLSNHSDKEALVEYGKALAQGIFVQYGITVDDDVSGIRKGGFGSTN